MQGVHVDGDKPLSKGNVRVFKHCPVEAVESFFTTDATAFVGALEYVAGFKFIGFLGAAIGAGGYSIGPYFGF